MQLKVGRKAPAKEFVDSSSEVLVGRAPSLVSDADSPYNKDWLLTVVQISPGAAGFIEIKKVHGIAMILRKNFLRRQ